MSKLGRDTILLGLDVSTVSTGYCFIDGTGKIIDSGAIRCSGSIPEKMQTLRNELAVLLNKHKPTIAAIEDMIAFRNGHIVKVLNQFIGVAYLTCFDYNGNDVEFYASSSLKAMIGVNPRAMKKAGAKPVDVKLQVLKTCELIYGLKVRPEDRVSQFDVADATLCAMKLLKELTQ